MFVTYFLKNTCILPYEFPRSLMSGRHEHIVWRCYTKFEKESGRFARCDGCGKEMAGIVQRMVSHAGVRAFFSPSFRTFDIDKCVKLHEKDIWTPGVPEEAQGTTSSNPPAKKLRQSRLTPMTTSREENEELNRQVARYFLTGGVRCPIFFL